MVYHDVGLTQLTYHNLHRLIVLDKLIQIFVVTIQVEFIPHSSEISPTAQRNEI
jgi:hypothetical protein